MVCPFPGDILMATGDVQLYKNAFVKNYHKPFITQHLKGNWFCTNRFINDETIRRHIEQEEWIGVFAPYYPQWGLIDFDNPSDGIIEKTIEQLRIEEGQYLLTSSPSYETDGNTHLLFKPVLEEEPPTTRQYLKHLKSALKARRGLIEVFPNTSNGIQSGRNKKGCQIHWLRSLIITLITRKTISPCESILRGLS